MRNYLILFILFNFFIVPSQAQTASAGPFLTTPQGVGIRLKATATGKGLTYKWTPSAFLNHDDVLNPITTPSTSIIYSLRVSDSNGLVGTSYTIVTVTCSFAVGQFYGGGIIYYVDGSGCHGLIASLTDQSFGVPWWNGTSLPIFNTSTDYGSGRDNTQAIIAAQGSGYYAASIVNGVTISGYNDWFLPSREELQLMMSSAAHDQLHLFSDTFYWSSSADFSVNHTAGIFDELYAWAVSSAEAAPPYRGELHHVRAIRTF
ncbi:hypothetical protein Mucpa_0128 [Mucilaginibacter paludis DSM 18603]|uniref:DUF1566 domain-containing protein n=2 Tax=Mucilaginibacter TaxID=423349 RepID=H1YDY9_9SPHI|nr:hypothetical protein Mucpa_0128 [Mucilaginibacter paludis DSM 18603]